MSVASVTWVHTLAEEHLEGTQESPEHEAPILPAPFAEDTYSDIEAEADPGQAVSQVIPPIDERPPMPEPTQRSPKIWFYLKAKRWRGRWTKAPRLRIRTLQLC